MSNGTHEIRMYSNLVKNRRKCKYKDKEDTGAVKQRPGRSRG